MDDLESVLAPVRAKAAAMHEAREAILPKARRLGQAAAKSIRHTHRREFALAEEKLREAREIAEECRLIMAGQPELSRSYLHDTEKEMVEAAAVLAIVRDLPLPGEELGAGPMAYLHGLGEAASEVRRFVLDEIRADRGAEAERILRRMEAIYEELITFDYSDTLTHGLRRTTDALRAVVERTRSDLTTTASQQTLLRALERNLSRRGD